MRKEYINQVYVYKTKDKLISIDFGLAPIEEIRITDNTVRGEVPPLEFMAPYSVYRITILQDKKVFTANFRPQELTFLYENVKSLNLIRNLSMVSLTREIMSGIKESVRILKWMAEKVQGLFKFVIHGILPSKKESCQTDISIYENTVFKYGTNKGKSILSIVMEFDVEEGKRILQKNMEFYGRYQGNEEMIRIMDMAVRSYPNIKKAAGGKECEVKGTGYITCFDSGYKYYPSKMDQENRNLVYRLVVSFDQDAESRYPFVITITNGYAYLRVQESGATQIDLKNLAGTEKSSIRLDWINMFQFIKSMDVNTAEFIHSQYGWLKTARDELAWKPKG